MVARFLADFVPHIWVNRRDKIYVGQIHQDLPKTTKKKLQNILQKKKTSYLAGFIRITTSLLTTKFAQWLLPISVQSKSLYTLEKQNLHHILLQKTMLEHNFLRIYLNDLIFWEFFWKYSHACIHTVFQEKGSEATTKLQ